MRKALYALLFTTLANAQLGSAETRHYHTAPPAPSVEHPEIAIPLIEIDPDTGEKRIYLTPGTDDKPLSFEEQVVSSSYVLQPDSEQRGLHQAIASLHQEMANRCPDGWLKLREWATPDNPGLKLHYAFTCLN